MYLDNPDPEYQVKQKQLKPSQAMRIGAALRPQCKNMYFHADGSCALGAMMEGCGMPYGTHFYEFRIKYPSLDRLFLNFDIGYKNDQLNWTREQIADWLESKGY